MSDFPPPTALATDKVSDEMLRLTYTKLSRMEPPPKGSVIKLVGMGDDKLLRVVNEPKWGNGGDPTAFTIEVVSEPTHCRECGCPDYGNCAKPRGESANH